MEEMFQDPSYGNKELLIRRIDPSQKQNFIILWSRVQSRYGPQIAFNFFQFLLQDTQLYYEYLFMPEQQLYSKVSTYIPDQQMDIRQSQNIEMIQIHDRQEQERMQDQIRSDQVQDMQEQTPDCFYYFQKMKENLRKDKEFANNFIDVDFQRFLQFYLSYQELQLIPQKDLAKQTKKYTNKSNQDSLMQHMLLVDSALYYSSPKYRLRITQILAIYLFLQKTEISKLLFQILTGEGKSTTIACLAAILAICGRNVDIITTNNILAMRDVEEKRKFYQSLAIKVDHNITPESDKYNQGSTKPKSCYSQGTVVYGTPFSYQVDLLYDEYKKKRTRNGRPYDAAIIDEVDSMFIDEKANQTLLSTPYAGFSELVLPMRILWQTIVMHNIVKQGDKLMLYKHGKAQGQIIKGQINEVMSLIINQIRDKFQNQIIPKWRLQFIQFSLRDWISSAIQAAHVYKQFHHYVIQKGRIIPVDYMNTGCLQKNVQWEHGLHQFLQIKHDLQVSTESMTSNFMSNIGHFSRYKLIYGMTGTLGSIQSKRFLQNTYQAQMLEIPPYRERRLKIQPGFFMYSEKQWIQKIIQSVTKKIKQKRAVLLICQTIQHVKAIQMAIKLRNISHHSLRRSITGQEKLSDLVDRQDIFIATNVAGRGTDLKASKQLIGCGGLHVIITFMPKNLRVQMQARGRAGRNGAPGSSQLIVNHQQYFNDSIVPFIPQRQFVSQNMERNIQLISLQIRDMAEAQAMKNDAAKVEQLRTKDRIFQYFCKVVGAIPDYQYNKAKRDALEQNWAMFLKKAQYLKLSKQEMQTQGKQLIDTFAVNSDGFYHPSHTVWRGVEQIRKNNYEEARGYFQQLQAADTTKVNKIAGRLMQSSIDIKLDDKKVKSKYPDAIKKMASCLSLIQERKDMVLGTRALTLSTNNRSIVDVMSGQSQRQAVRLQEAIQPNNRRVVGVMQMQNQRQAVRPQEAIQLDQNNIQIQPRIQRIRNGDIQPIQRNHQDQLMRCPQIKVLDSVGNHIRQQVQKISKIKSNEYADIKFQPLSEIIGQALGSQESTEQKINELMTDMPYLPVVEIKKIKVPWWKRLIVFALGVLQVCIGSLIVMASSGAAASFGAFMIQSGIKDCMAALFTPEVCADLGKFYTQKSLQYAMSLATIGLQGMSQLATLSRNGFQTIRNSTMSQVMKKVANGIGQGFLQGSMDWRGIVQKQIFQGLSSKILGQNKNMIGNSPAQSFKILQKPEFKEIVKEGIKEQTELQFKGKQIQNKFEKQAQITIKNIINQLYPNFLIEMSQMQIQPENIRIIIENNFNQAFSDHFGSQNKTQVYKQMLYFIAQNLQDKELAQKLIKQFKIDQLIKRTVQNISKCKDYSVVIEGSQRELRNKIIQSFNKISIKYHDQCKKLQDSLNNQRYQIENSALTLAQRNTKNTQFNKKAQSHQSLVQKSNAFVTQFQLMDQGNKIVKFLINMGVVQKGKISKNLQQFTDLHPYAIQGLLGIKDFETGQAQFKEKLQAVAYNSFAGVTFKALAQIIDNSSCSISRLKTIRNGLFDALKKSDV